MRSDSDSDSDPDPARAPVPALDNVVVAVSIVDVAYSLAIRRGR